MRFKFVLRTKFITFGHISKVIFFHVCMKLARSLTHTLEIQILFSHCRKSDDSRDKDIKVSILRQFSDTSKDVRVRQKN